MPQVSGGISGRGGSTRLQGQGHDQRGQRDKGARSPSITSVRQRAAEVESVKKSTPTKYGTGRQDDAPHQGHLLGSAAGIVAVASARRPIFRPERRRRSNSVSFATSPASPAGRCRARHLVKLSGYIDARSRAATSRPIIITNRSRRGDAPRKSSRSPRALLSRRLWRASPVSWTRSTQRVLLAGQRRSR